MDRPIVNTLGFCSGAGMLEIGVSLGLEYLGYRAHIAALCEWESYSTACLMARMDEKTLEPAPIFSGDIAAFPGKKFRGLVDIVVAGFPCQPWSHAGKQEGTADERWLWPELARILRDTQSPLGFFENVPGLISGGGLHYVLDELAGMGFNAEWCSITAESVGASHRRQRVFILAYRKELRAGRLSKGRGAKGWYRTADAGGGQQAVADALRAGGQQPRPGRERIFNSGKEVGNAASNDEQRNSLPGIDRERQPLGGSSGRNGSGDVADAAKLRRRPTVGDAEHGAAGDGRSGKEESPPNGKRGRVLGPSDPGGILADTQQPGSQGDGPGIPQRGSQPIARDGNGGILPLFAPGPAADWSEIPPHLWPAVVADFRLLVDGMAVVVDQSRSDALRVGGNGVVPLVASVALVTLMRRAGLA